MLITFICVFNMHFQFVGDYSKIRIVSNVVVSIVVLQNFISSNVTPSLLFTCFIAYL